MLQKNYRSLSNNSNNVEKMHSLFKKIDLDKNTKDEINTIKRDLKEKLNEFLNSDTLTKIKNTISKDSTVTDGIFEKYKDNLKKDI